MKKPLLILSVLFLFGCIGCSPYAHISGPYPWLPADFNPKNGVVLIEKVAWPQRQQRKMEEFMKASYSYKYEFVEPADLDKLDTKYSDKNVYRFVIVSTASTHKMHWELPPDQRLPVEMFDFYFVDRSGNRAYPATGKGASWASVVFKWIITTALKQHS